MPASILVIEEIYASATVIPSANQRGFAPRCKRVAHTLHSQAVSTMNKRPTRDSYSQQRPSKSSVSGQLGFRKNARAPAGSTTLETVILKDGSKIFYRDTSGKKRVVEFVDAPAGKVLRQERIRFSSGVIPKIDASRSPAGVHRKEMNDPHLTLLSGSAFDAVAKTLENPPAPSEGAKQAVARARLWRR